MYQSKEDPAAGVTRAARGAGTTLASSPARAALRAATPYESHGIRMTVSLSVGFTNVS